MRSGSPYTSRLGSRVLNSAGETRTWPDAQRLLVEDRHLAKAFEIVRHRGARVFDAGFGIAVVDEQNAVGVRDSKRPEEHVVDDGEQRRVGADAHEQRQRCRQCEAFVLPEESEADAQILHERCSVQSLESRGLDNMDCQGDLYISHEITKARNQTKFFVFSCFRGGSGPLQNDSNGPLA